MKRSGVLNHRLSHRIAMMGHMDSLVVSDAGLPIPDSTERIDLAVTARVPGFLQTLAAILEELKVEQAVIAREALEVSPDLHAGLMEILGDIPVSYISHAQLKKDSGTAVAVVRTGEFTPYANVILYSGVVF